MNVPAIIATGLAVGALYALLAMGLQLSYSGTDVLNFAHGDVAVSGAFCYWYMTTQAHISGWLALMVSIVSGAIAGAIVYLVLRIYSAKSTLIASIASIAISFVIQGVLQYSFGSEPKISQPLLAGNPIHLGSTVVPRQNLVVMGAAVVLGAALFLVINKSRLGLSVRATFDNSEAARTIGVSVFGVQLAVFMLGGLASFTAGAVVAPIIGASFASGLGMVVAAFMATVLGGLGRLWMAGVGGLLLGLIQSVIGSTSAGQYTQTVLFGLLMVALLLRPQGVLGSRARAS